MKITKRKLKKIIREEHLRLINERGTGNPAFAVEERALMSAVLAFHEKYMLSMGMNPSNRLDTQRSRSVISDIINTVLGE